MFLKEIKTNPTKQAYRSKRDEKRSIAGWLKSMGISNYTINDDLTVDVDGTVSLSYEPSSWYGNHRLSKPLGSIPIQFGVVTNGFGVAHNELTSLKGAPRILEQGNFMACFNNLTSIDFLPQTAGSIYIHENPISSLHNIHKQVRFVSHEFVAPWPITHILGVLKIKGMKIFRVDEKTGIEGAKEVNAIIKKHLDGARDIYLAQDDLIAAGLVEQAKL